MKHYVKKKQKQKIENTYIENNRYHYYYINVFIFRKSEHIR